MDGKGAWRDNVFVERLWRSVKYEEVYLQGLRLGERGARGPCALPRLSTIRGDRTGLDGKTPDEFYFASLPATRKAA